MRDRLLFWVKRFQAGIQAFAVNWVLKRGLIPVALFASYFFGIGLTSVLVRVFKPRTLLPFETSSGSSWLEAQGYDPDERKCLKQS